MRESDQKASDLDGGGIQRGRPRRVPAVLVVAGLELGRRVHRLHLKPVAVDRDAQMMRRKRRIVHPQIVVGGPPDRQGLSLLEVAAVHGREVRGRIALQPLLRVGSIFFDLLDGPGRFRRGQPGRPEGRRRRDGGHEGTCGRCEDPPRNHGPIVRQTWRPRTR